MRPGDRKKRCKESSAASGMISVALAIFVITGVDWPPGIIIGAFCLFMAFLDYRDFMCPAYLRKPNYKIPDRARRDARMPGLRGEIASAVIREMEAEWKRRNPE